MFHRLASTCAPLSVHSGGKPIALPTKPATPGPRPKASQADSLGAPPSSEPTRCIEGGEGSVLNGLAPVTSSLLKSAPKDAAKSQASPAGDTRGLLVRESAPHAHTMAAFWLPVRSMASASSASPPRPIGMRSDGTGTGTTVTAVATEV